MHAGFLELGCANGRLGELYKSVNPDTYWVGIDFSVEAVKIAKKCLDRVEQIDLNNLNNDSFLDLGDFDIIIGGLLERLTDPEAVLSRLHGLVIDAAQIYCCLPNMSHISVMERLLSGDFSYDEMGLLDKTHVRHFSQSSAFKTFLDSGWTPHLLDHYMTEPVDSPFFQSLLTTIGHLGVPAKTAQRNLGIYKMILKCVRTKLVAPTPQTAKGKFAVIVPMNRPWEFNLNVLRSPGLKEINAQIFFVQGASSAAEAFNEAKDRIDCDWILFSHQDVYFPKNAGFQLEQALTQLDAQEVADVPVGFAGISAQDDGTMRYAGLVVDRTTLFSCSGSHTAISIDEFAVLIRKNSALKIDASLGWHTWATDLCMQSMCLSHKPNAVILEIPLFHNSLNDNVLPESFYCSGATLLAKYPKMDTITTLCSTFARNT